MMIARGEGVEVTPHHEIEEDEDRKERDRNEDVVEEHQHLVDPAAEVARRQPTAIEMMRLKMATVTPKVSVLLNANVSCQNMSWRAGGAEPVLRSGRLVGIAV
jgi:hypothetical protein